MEWKKAAVAVVLGVGLGVAGIHAAEVLAPELVVVTSGEPSLARPVEKHFEFQEVPAGTEFKCFQGKDQFLSFPVRANHKYTGTLTLMGAETPE
jgi:hypothetical protein